MIIFCRSFKREDPSCNTRTYLGSFSRIPAGKAGIEENFTSYVTYHSFASLAAEMEVTITGIRDMFGHERVSTAEADLSDLRKCKIDE